MCRLLPLGLIFVFASCVDTPDATESDVTDETVFYTTVAHVTADGVVMDEPQPITAKEQRRMVEERRAHQRGELVSTATASWDPACANASLWLFDRTDFSGNQICFRGCGYAPLRNYFRTYRGIDGRLHPLGTWEVLRGSYWPGSTPGAVVTYSPGYYDQERTWYPAWGPANTFDGSAYNRFIGGVVVGVGELQQCP